LPKALAEFPVHDELKPEYQNEGEYSNQPKIGWMMMHISGVCSSLAK
jgi:hypothetical protein